jgi:hypothetical protein
MSENEKYGLTAVSMQVVSYSNKQFPKATRELAQCGAHLLIMPIA